MLQSLIAGMRAPCTQASAAPKSRIKGVILPIVLSHSFKRTGLPSQEINNHWAHRTTSRHY
jgi:hypothetical protein